MLESQVTPRTSEDLKKLGGIISKPKFDPYVKLVSDALHLAATTDSLLQVKILVLQGYAYNAVHDDKISEDDLDVIDSVARALLMPVRTLYHTTQYISVPWGFKDTSENYERYIKPWDVAYLEHFPELLKAGQDPGKRSDVFFGTSVCLSEVGYQALVGAFTHWSAPKVAGIWARIAKGVVSKKELSDPERVVMDVDGP